MEQHTTGYVHSTETRKKISKARTGKKHSPETIAKMRKARLGTKVSDATKQRMSAARIARSKPVIIKGRQYINVKEASKQLGVSTDVCYRRVNSDNYPDWQYRIEEES